MMAKTNQNELFPVFLVPEMFNILIVGGGDVAFEKLHFLLKSSPSAKVTIVTKELGSELQDLAISQPRVKVILKSYEASDLTGKNIIIAATNRYKTNWQVWLDAKRANLLVNVADTPQLCDFYMSSIVTKGDLKIAISTNGKSPTFAKRLRQALELNLPNETSNLIENLNIIRSMLNGSFGQKVRELNNLTDILIQGHEGNEKTNIAESA